MDRLFCLADVICTDRTCKNDNIYHCSSIGCTVIRSFVSEKADIFAGICNFYSGWIHPDEKRNQNVSISCMECGRRSPQYPRKYRRRKIIPAQNSRRNQVLSFYHFRTDQYCKHDLRRTSDHRIGHGDFINCQKRKRGICIKDDSG